MLLLISQISAFAPLIYMAFDPVCWSENQLRIKTTLLPRQNKLCDWILLLGYLG